MSAAARRAQAGGRELASARADAAMQRLVAWAEHSARERSARAPARLDFDARGDLQCIVEADGSRREFAYDAQRRLVRSCDAGGSTHYHYDGADRLVRVVGPAGEVQHAFDAAGRWVAVQRSAAAGTRHRHDAAGRVVETRRADIACHYAYDAEGRVCEVAQAIGAVRIAAQLAFDAQGRLATLRLPGGHVVGYAWTASGRPAALSFDGREIVRWSLAVSTETIDFAGGVRECRQHDPVDARLLERSIAGPQGVLEHVAYRYDAAGRVLEDGQAAYRYAAGGELASQARRDGATPEVRAPALERVFGSDGELSALRRRGELVARMGYDAKGRLAWLEAGARHERYLYGPADELLAACDAQGQPLRLYLPSPVGCVAEWEGGALRFLHLDRRGASSCITGERGELLARHRLDAWGAPLDDVSQAPPPWFGARRYEAALGLYRFGARWYDPWAHCFLTADDHTAAPDDARLVHPLVTGAAQVALRDRLLAGWLRQPSARDRFGFCHGDPVNRVDPNGHWSFGGVLLSLLGALWTLPNTLFGLLIEATCLVGEVVRWLAWLFSGGNLTWATPGFDVAASSRLNAFALVFRGGWLGSFRDLQGITFGNVFFVYHDWENLPEIAAGGTVSPPAYGGTVQIPIHDALYEHELRHTNQYGWLGPFFHLGLPVFGVYEWEVIFHGYYDAWLERDAREHSGY